MNNPLHELIGVITTYPDNDELPTFIKKIVEQKVAVCALSLPSDSSYLWEGSYETSKERFVLFKTTTERKDSLFQMIKKEHPYSVPFISCIDFNNTLSEYLKWANSN